MSAPADWSLLPAGLAALAVGYLLGSIPFGLLLTKLFGRGDLRSVGSGNIGATNVLRTGRKGLAALTLLLDLLKGTASVAVGAQWSPDAAVLGGVGAILGHIALGFDLSILSMFGVVALTGVVINDGLVMVDFINRFRERHGGDLDLAIREAGVARFRPILLTSLTTFVGLAPLMMERSMQARFLIPMAVSLAFGVLFATFITLMLVPAGYMILEDLRAGVALARGDFGGILARSGSRNKE